MIDKQLNRIRDKLSANAIKNDALILTKDEGEYLLRLVKIAEDHLQSWGYSRTARVDNNKCLTGE